MKRKKAAFKKSNPITFVVIKQSLLRNEQQFTHKFQGDKSAVQDTKIGSMYDLHKFLMTEKFYKNNTAEVKPGQNKGVCYQ